MGDHRLERVPGGAWEYTRGPSSWMVMVMWVGKAYVRGEGFTGVHFSPSLPSYLPPYIPSLFSRQINGCYWVGEGTRN